MTSNLSKASSSSSWKDRLEGILSQERLVLNFEHYTVSEEHTKRMTELAKQVPTLYANPEITPRSKWFQHPRFHENSQMPPFHVHFRQEMKECLNYLYEAYSNEDNDAQHKHLLRAYRTFSGSMRGLNGHVSIEEYACFPLYRDCFPQVNIDFLYHDHKSLKDAERKTMHQLEALGASQQDITKEEIMQCLQQLLDFDDQLMAHLGEEEEVVVPMSLTDQEIWF